MPQTGSVTTCLREYAEVAVFEPQTRSAISLSVVVGDDDDAAAVVGGELAQQPCDLAAMA